MVSVKTMVMQCAGLIDTSDVSEWENKFLKSVCGSESLSPKQAEKLEQIWQKHFEG